jgi:hypothetical protein
VGDDFSGGGRNPLACMILGFTDMTDPSPALDKLGFANVGTKVENGEGSILHNPLHCDSFFPLLRPQYVL